MKAVQDFVSRVKKAGQVLLESELIQNWDKAFEKASGRSPCTTEDMSKFAHKQIAALDAKLRDSSDLEHFVKGASLVMKDESKSFGYEFIPNIEVYLKTPEVECSASIDIEKETNFTSGLSIIELDLRVVYKDVMNSEDLVILNRNLRDIEVSEIICRDGEEESKEKGISIPELEFGSVFKYNSFSDGTKREVHFAPDKQAIYLPFIREEIERNFFRVPESPAELGEISIIGFPLFNGGSSDGQKKQLESEFQEQFKQFRDSLTDRYIRYLVESGEWYNSFLLNRVNYEVKGERTFNKEIDLYIEPTLKVTQRRRRAGTSTEPRVDLEISVGGNRYNDGWKRPLTGYNEVTSTQRFNNLIDQAARVFGVEYKNLKGNVVCGLSERE